ncbi:unnamed protein product [Pylaiella littoralis]
MKNLVIYTMIKNESKDLKEWIDFHVRQGVDGFVIYDHNSTDNSLEILKQYPPSLVKIKPLKIIEPMHARIHMARETMKLSKGTTRYVLFSDVDEYLFNPDRNSTALKMIDQLFNCYPDAGGIGVNWLVFGTRCETFGQELNLETSSIVNNCLFRADKSHHVNHHIKTIFKPHLIENKYTDPHGFHYKTGFRCIDTNGTTIAGPFHRIDFPTDKLKLHHYFISSIDFFIREKLDRIAFIHKDKPFSDVLETQAKLMRELRTTRDTSAIDILSLN